MLRLNPNLYPSISINEAMVFPALPAEGRDIIDNKIKRLKIGSRVFTGAIALFAATRAAVLPLIRGSGVDAKSIAATLFSMAVLSPIKDVFLNKRAFKIGVRAWAAQEAPGEDRLEAAKRIIKACILRPAYLNLEGLGLRSLPTEVFMLWNLTRLNLNGNQLRYLSDGICKLDNLEWLGLIDNQLWDLPDDIGYLESLTRLDLSGNQMWDLPESISQLGIQAVRGFNRVVQPEEDDYNEHQNLTDWINCAGEEVYNQLFQLPLVIKDDQKADLQDWLERLKKTNKSRTDRIDLAKIVCDILLTVKDDPDFRSRFFDIIQVGLTQCGDRAAMSLNFVYTAWMLNNLSDCSPEDKFNILIGCMRTEKVRQIVADLININEPTLAEDVEVFLYAETRLRESLGLITIDQDMLYIDIGDRRWLHLEEIQDQVENMSDLEIIDSLESMGSLWGEFIAEYYSFENETILGYLSDLLDPITEDSDEGGSSVYEDIEDISRRSDIISKLTPILNEVTPEIERNFMDRGAHRGGEADMADILMEKFRVSRYLYIKSEIEEPSDTIH